MLSLEAAAGIQKGGQVVYSDDVAEVKGLPSVVTKMAVWSLALAADRPPEGLAEAIEAISFSGDELGAADWALSRKLGTGEEESTRKRGAQVRFYTLHPTLAPRVE